MKTDLQRVRLKITKRTHDELSILQQRAPLKNNHHFENCSDEIPTGLFHARF
jgi:hypothetical protein